MSVQGNVRLTLSFQHFFHPCLFLLSFPYFLLLLTPSLLLSSSGCLALVSLNVGRHALPLSVVLLHADSLVLLLTESIGKKIAGWVLQARYVIML